jgi:hypothetical protein
MNDEMAMNLGMDVAMQYKKQDIVGIV